MNDDNNRDFQQPQTMMNHGQPMPGNPYQQMPPQMPQPPRNQDNTLKIVIIVLLVLLLVGGAILGTYLITKGSKEAAKEPENVTVVDTVKVVETVEQKAEPKADGSQATPEDKGPVNSDHYVGSIGKYNVECYIYFNGNAITGKYRYLRQKGAGGWLDLVGERSGNHVEIYEYNNNGEQCGYWDGTKSGGTISGDFWNYKGTHYNFVLKNQ